MVLEQIIHPQELGKKAWEAKIVGDKVEERKLCSEDLAKPSPTTTITVTV
jgi:hypothetical protein